MKRKFLITCLLVLTVLTTTVIAQRLRKHGALVDATTAGALTIRSRSGQAITLTGATGIVGNTTITGTAAVSSTLGVSGKATFTADPASTALTNASLVINPATSAANENLLAVLNNGSSRLAVDAEGDTAVAGTMAVTGAATLTGGVTVGSGGSAVSKVLTGTASLDFTALAANTCEEATITVTGAADGDAISLGIPAGVGNVDNKATFTALISAADTVLVRRCNPTGGATADPAAGTVRATVIKH